MNTDWYAYDTSDTWFQNPSYESVIDTLRYGARVSNTSTQSVDPDITGNRQGVYPESSSPIIPLWAEIPVDFAIGLLNPYAGGAALLDDVIPALTPTLNGFDTTTNLGDFVFRHNPNSTGVEKTGGYNRMLYESEVYSPSGEKNLTIGNSTLNLLRNDRLGTHIDVDIVGGLDPISSSSRSSTTDLTLNPHNMSKDQRQVHSIQPPEQSSISTHDRYGTPDFVATDLPLKFKAKAKPM